MVSSQPEQRFRDIIKHVQWISENTAELTFEALFDDSRNYGTRLAVERCLAIISEAAVKLDSLAEDLAPEISWHDIRGIGNRLRHSYDEIDEKVIWAAITNDVPVLLTACQAALDHLGTKESNPDTCPGVMPENG